MATIEPPNKKKKKTKVSIQKPSIKALEQTPPNAVKPLQLKLPEITKNEFKAFAAIRGRPMNELFLEMFEEYKKKHA